MKDSNLDLERYFAPHTVSDWKDAAEKLLKGLPLEKLNTKTYESITLKPLYTEEDRNLSVIKRLNEQKVPLKSKANTTYFISQHIPYENNKQFLDAIATALEGGVNELNIELTEQTADLLTYIKAPNIFLRFYFKNFQSYNDIHKILDSIDKKTNIALGGGFALADSGTITNYINSVQNSTSKLNNLKSIFEARHKKLHLDGIDSISEIVAVLSTAKRYLELLLDAGFTQKDLGKYIRLSVSIGSNFFMELAKFRALKILWEGIQREYGLDVSTHIHAYTGKINKTLFDPYTNLLRLSTEAFSAIAGGVDSLEIDRFDFLYDNYNEFSEHLSRNIHHILSDEFELANVVDPASGSYFIENLTQEIIRQAWTDFQNIEHLGGVDKNINIFEDRAKNKSIERLKNLGKRKDVLVGINMFPDSLDNYVDKLDQFNAVKDINRLSYNYESLKLACLNYKNKHNTYPSIVQINYGLTRTFRLRADWVADFFKVSGIDVQQFDDVASIDSAIDIIADSKFVVLCSSDEEYKNFVPELSAKLKKQNKDIFLMLAGNKEKTVSAEFVDEFVNIKTNNYEFLHRLLVKMGVINE